MIDPGLLGGVIGVETEVETMGLVYLSRRESRGQVSGAELRLDLPLFPREDRSMELWAENLEDAFALRLHGDTMRHLHKADHP